MMLCGDLFMKNYIKEYINENFKVIAIIVICLVLGLVMGMISYHFLEAGTKNELIKTMTTTLDLTKAGNFENINVIRNGIVSNFILVAVIYAIALTLLSPILTSMLSLAKGFAIGMYIPTIFQIFGPSKGILALLLMVILPNLLYISSFIYMCTNAIRFHYELIGAESKLPVCMKEIIKIVIGFSLMFVGVLIEQITSGWVISLYQSLG